MHVSQSRVRVAWRKESNSFTLRQKKRAQKAPTVTFDQFLMEERLNLNTGHILQNFPFTVFEGEVWRPCVVLTSNYAKVLRFENDKKGPFLRRI